MTFGWFQSTRLREARHRSRCTPEHRDTVSIHAPAGGATCDVRKTGTRCLVSIHAPAGGATDRFRQAAHVVTVSIHAPAGGATNENERVLVHAKFQSTRLREARLCAALKVAFKQAFQSTRLREARHLFEMEGYSV